MIESKLSFIFLYGALRDFLNGRCGRKLASSASIKHLDSMRQKIIEMKSVAIAGFNVSHSMRENV